MTKPYAFEGKDERSTSEKPNRTRVGADTMLQRLFGKEDLLDKLIPEDRRLLMTYSGNHQADIQWYIAERQAQEKKRKYMVLLSIALLIFLPLIIAFLPNFIDWVTNAGGEGTSPLTIEAQITSIVAVFIALHKALQQWFLQRNRVALLWEASSDLKEDIYALEDQWSGKNEALLFEGNASNETVCFSQAFREDLMKGIAAARAIIRKEKTEFFEKIEKAKPIDVTGLLSSARKDATTLTADYLPVSFKKAVEEAKESEVRNKMVARLKAALVDIEARLATLTTDIKKAKDAKEEQSHIDGLLQRFQALRMRRDSIEMDLINTEFDLSA